MANRRARAEAATRRLRALATALALSWTLVLAAPVGAETVYGSVDEQGVVTYSQTLSPGATTAEALEVPETSPSRISDGVARLEQMRNVAEDIEAARVDAREAEHERAGRVAEARASKKNATPERLGLLREKVRLARERLDAVRGP